VIHADNRSAEQRRQTRAWVFIVIAMPEWPSISRLQILLRDLGEPIRQVVAELVADSTGIPALVLAYR
jgi:hypothetical protein